jgi:hypothetical protein
VIFKILKKKLNFHTIIGIFSWSRAFNFILSAPGQSLPTTLADIRDRSHFTTLRWHRSTWSHADRRSLLFLMKGILWFILPRFSPVCTSEHANTSQFPTELDQWNDHTSNHEWINFLWWSFWHLLILSSHIQTWTDWVINMEKYKTGGLFEWFLSLWWNQNNATNYLSCLMMIGGTEITSELSGSARFKLNRAYDLKFREMVGFNYDQWCTDDKSRAEDLKTENNCGHYFIPLVIRRFPHKSWHSLTILRQLFISSIEWPWFRRYQCTWDYRGCQPS